MSQKTLLTALAITLTLCLSLDDAWGQRGGRAGGGGARGGNNPGANRSPSNTRERSPGTMNRSSGPAGGRSPGVENRGISGQGAAGARSGGPLGGLGGQSRDQFSTPSSGQLNGFLGLPSDQGLRKPGQSPPGQNVDANYGTVEGTRGGEAGGVAVTGPQGNTAGRAVGIGSQGGMATVGGVQGADGASAARGAAAGPNGGVTAGRAAVGPEGGAAAGFAHVSPTGRQTTATAVRSNYNHWDVYGNRWYTNNPGAWYAAGWATNTAWRASTWNTAAGYYGYPNATPIYYDYGNNVTYQDNVVYVSGSEAGTSEQYYDQAASLATSGAQAEAPADGDWLPLGVFALTKPDQTESTLTLQLAVNKQGVIRGNYTDTSTDQTHLIQGSVDKQTQRVAFTVGDDTTNLIETGLYNLTQDEAPCLIHFGSERTEQWLLVRLQNPELKTE